MPIEHQQKIKFSLIASAVVVWSIGFADLARGGTTLSAFALALAYCLLIPAALWYGADRSAPVAGKGDERPSYRTAGLVGACVLALYLVTMAPSTAMWDTSEYIAAAYTFGLPHPPGNPFFVILGHVFSLLPIAHGAAARVNVLAAVSSAASAGLWCLVTEQILRAWIAPRWVRLAGAVAGAVIGATAFTVWNQSVVNEKVYTVSLAGIAIVSWLAVRWSVGPDEARADRYLVMIAYLCGLGYANHMAGMLPAPAMAAAVLVRRPATFVRWRLLAACAVAMFIGLTPFATQPIRSAYFPTPNEGEPTDCRTKLEWSCTFSEGTLQAFEYNFNRAQYGKPSLAERQATLSQQLGLWWLYFKWQWVRDASGNWAALQAVMAALMFVLGLLGAWVHFRRDRNTFWYVGALMFTITLLLIYYLNFKLGWSQDQDLNAPHEVRDRDYFFIWSFSAWGVWAALGLVHLWELVAELATGGGERRERLASHRGWSVASPVLAIALVPLFCNWTSASRAKHRATRDMAADLLNSVEPYGVLITVGDNDTFPLWYAQEVEGIRRDVVVAETSLLNTDWYVRQLIRRPIYAYDAAKGPAIYRTQTWTKPSKPPLDMTLVEADSVPPYYGLTGPMVFTAGPLHATIDPKLLEYGVLQRSDALVLHMIHDSWPARPIYFARSAVGYPRQLGIANDMLTQGLAWKLFIPPAASTRDTMFVAGDGWLDIPRTHVLWRDTFQAPRAVIDEGKWIDRSSVSMPAMYLFCGIELSEALRATNQGAAARAVLATTERIARATNLDQIVTQLRGDSLQGDTAQRIVPTTNR